MVNFRYTLITILTSILHRARSLVWIRRRVNRKGDAQAFGAEDPGFKSLRARQKHMQSIIKPDV